MSLEDLLPLTMLTKLQYHFSEKSNIDILT